jgi:hypothetical protein
VKTQPPQSPPGKTSRGLEVVYDRDKEELAKLPPSERRRLPRLNFSGEQFRHTATGKVFLVSDLSLEGMALRLIDRNDFLLFPIATLLEGRLNLKGEKLAVNARVRHLGPDTVGCEFEDKLEDSTRQALNRYLDPVSLGRDLKPIPSSEGGTLWYHGPSGTDLLLKRGNDGVYRIMTLYVQGSYVQWSEASQLSTGRTRATDQQGENRGLLRFETLWLEQDDALDRGKLSVAKTLILSSNLPEDFKKWCTRKLEVLT